MNRTLKGFAPGAVIVPTGTTPRFLEFGECLGELLVPPRTEFYRVSSPAAARGRNQCLRKMMPKTHLQWALLLDDDHYFSPDLLYRLLLAQRETKAAVISPLYVLKYPPFQPVCYHVEGGILPLQSIDPSTPFEVSKTGASGMLVQRPWLERLVDDWFVPTGENENSDVNFCTRIREAGGTVYVDPRILFGHSNVSTFTPAWIDGRWAILVMVGGQTYALPAAQFAPQPFEMPDQPPQAQDPGIRVDGHPMAVCR